MWRQVFHQLWNQRRANAWLGVELTLVTVILWYGIDLVYNYEGSALQPKGYDTDCVFDLMVGTKPMEVINDADNRRAGEDFTYLYNLVKDYPGVEEVCAYYGSVPYSDEQMVEGYAPHTDSTHVEQCYIRYVTASYFRVFRLKPLAGRLDEEHWSPAEHPMPVLMSADLADSLFHAPTYAGALGKTCFNPYWLQTESPVTNYRVMAVLPRHKTDEYERYEPFIYLPVDKPLFWQHIGVRVLPDHVAGFAERFRRDMQPVLATFWYRTRKRRCEIALRMAVGSSCWGVTRYFLGEGLALLLLSVLPALFIAVNLQVADLTVHTLVDASPLRFIGCFVAAWLVLAVLIISGIWYPARRAMRIQPAEALHDE